MSDPMPPPTDTSHDDSESLRQCLEEAGYTVRNLTDDEDLPDSPAVLLPNGRRFSLFLHPSQASQVQQTPESPNSQHFYEGILKSADVEKSENTVGIVPGSPVPTNRVLDRITLRLFDLPEESSLLMGDGWIRGFALDYDVSRESAGWALHEWIGTQSLAPYQDTALSDSTVETAAAKNLAEKLQVLDGHTQRDRGAALGTENLTSSARATTAGIGIQAGAGQKSGIDGSDPVTKLTQAVTGAIQVGLSASHGRSFAEQQSTVERALTEKFQRDLVSSRDGLAAASTHANSMVSDARSMTALRNLTGKSLNLATFSLAHQWRVATVVADYRPVVYVPIDRVDADFDLTDVFLNYAALDYALLEDDLRMELKKAADSYEDPSDSPEASYGASKIIGTLVISELGSGAGAHLELEVSFQSDAGPRKFIQNVDTNRAGALQSVEFELDDTFPLRDYLGTSVTFVTAENADPFTTIGTLQLFVVLADGTQVLINQTQKLRLRRSQSTKLQSELRRNFLTMISSAPPAPPDGASRLLAHLNHRRAYYRLAIDLQLDSATRFARLKGRLHGNQEVPQSTSPQGEEKAAEEVRLAELQKLLPISFEPLGVLGGHIAFRTSEESHDIANRAKYGVGGEPTFFLTSTPSAGTFVEAIPGAAEIGTPGYYAKPPVIPTGSTESDWGYPWPDRVTPSEATIDRVLTSPSVDIQPGAGTKVPTNSPGPPTNPTADEAATVGAEASAGAKAAAGDAQSGQDAPAGGAPDGRSETQAGESED